MLQSGISAWRASEHVTVMTEALHLNEHEAAKWLAKDDLDSVKWLPADLEVIKTLLNKTL